MMSTRLKTWRSAETFDTEVGWRPLRIWWQAPTWPSGGGVKSKTGENDGGIFGIPKNGGKPWVKIDESKRENGEKDILHTFSLCTCLAVRKLMPSGKYGSLCKGLQYCLVLSGKYQHFLQVGISPS